MTSLAVRCLGKPCASCTGEMHSGNLVQHVSIPAASAHVHETKHLKLHAAGIIPVAPQVCLLGRRVRELLDSIDPFQVSEHQSDLRHQLCC